MYDLLLIDPLVNRKFACSFPPNRAINSILTYKIMHFNTNSDFLSPSKYQKYINSIHMNYSAML